MLNRWCGNGYMVRQPELRVTSNGTEVTQFTIGVGRRQKDETDFVDVVCFGKLAQIVADYGDKGRLVAVEGRLQSRKWEDKEGNKRTAWEIIADSVQFMGKGNNDE